MNNLNDYSANPNDFARQLFSGLPQRYDLLAQLLSFGQDYRWRTEMISHIAPYKPRHVLDVATGPAGVARMLIRKGIRKVTAVDLSQEMLSQAQSNIKRLSLESKINLVLSKGEELAFDDKTFDGLSFTYLLRYVADPSKAIKELARVLKDGSPMVNLEFYVPQNYFWKSLWSYYTKYLLPALGKQLGGQDWEEVGNFLGPNIENYYRNFTLEQHLQAWREAGFENVAYKTMSVGGGIIFWGTKTSG